MKIIDENVIKCPSCGYVIPSDEPSFFLTPGTVLNNRYYIGKNLGAGGFGITYIGQDMMLERTVAVKEYFPNGLVSRSPDGTTVQSYSGNYREQFHTGLDRFISEARRLAEFGQGQGIVQIYDCIYANGTGYIVMEYLSGCTVRDLVKKGHLFSFFEASQITLPVLNALEVVHSHDIIHRDVAPDNIFVTDEGKVILIDFGASHYSDTEDERTISVILKHGYAPEEQYRTHTHLGPWTDLYGVSATMYYMVTGKKPESANNRIINDELTPPSSYNPGITPQQENVILKGMEVIAADRYRSASEMRNAILSCMQEGDSSDKTVKLPHQTQKRLSLTQEENKQQLKTQSAAEIKQKSDTVRRRNSDNQRKNNSNQKKKGTMLAVILTVIMGIAFAAVFFIYRSNKQGQNDNLNVNRVSEETAAISEINKNDGSSAANASSEDGLSSEVAVDTGDAELLSTMTGIDWEVSQVHADGSVSIDNGTIEAGTVFSVTPSPSENERYAAVSVISGYPSIETNLSTGDVSIKASSAYPNVRIKYYYQDSSAETDSSKEPLWLGFVTDASGSMGFSFNTPEKIKVNGFSANQTLTYEEVSKILDSFLTDNSGLSYNNYRYYVMTNEERGEYSALSYWNGTTGPSAIIDGKKATPALSEEGTIIGIVENNENTSPGWYFLNSVSEAASDTLSTSKMLTGSTSVDFFVDEENYLCCHYYWRSNDDQKTSYVYERQDNNPVRVEVLQDLEASIVLAARKYFETPMFSMVRFSNSSFECDKLMTLDWTAKPDIAVGSLNLGYSGGTTAGELQEDGEYLYNYYLAAGTSTRTGLSTFLQKLGPRTNSSEKRVVLIIGDGADTNSLGTEADSYGFSAMDYAEELKTEGYLIASVLIRSSSGTDENAEMVLKSLASTGTDGAPLYFRLDNADRDSVNMMTEEIMEKTK